MNEKIYTKAKQQSKTFNFPKKNEGNIRNGHRESKNEKEKEK